MILGEVEDCIIVDRRRLLEWTNRAKFLIIANVGLLGGRESRTKEGKGNIDR